MSNSIRLANIISDSIVDGPGFRMTLFTQGCLFRCEGCHNESTWDINGGTLYEIKDIQKKWRKNPLIEGITLSGGEPFLQTKECLEIAKLATNDGLDIIIYTGFLYEDLVKKNDSTINELLSLTKYLIDGPFILEKRSLMLLFRGSSNQRIIDVKKTKEQKKIVLMDESGYIIG